MNKPLCELTHIEALARVRELEAEANESACLRDKMTALLTGVANTLNGSPATNSSHSWHNLPELARAAVDRQGTAAIREKAPALAFWWSLVCADHELSGEPPMPDADVILHWMMDDASAMVTAGQVRELLAAIYPAEDA